MLPRTQSVPTIRCDRSQTNTLRGIPGYRGYVPGKKSEGVIAGLYNDVVNEAQHVTKKLTHNQQEHSKYLREKGAFDAYATEMARYQREGRAPRDPLDQSRAVGSTHEVPLNSRKTDLPVDVSGRDAAVFDPSKAASTGQEVLSPGFNMGNISPNPRSNALGTGRLDAGKYSLRSASLGGAGQDQPRPDLLQSMSGRSFPGGVTANRGNDDMGWGDVPAAGDFRESRALNSIECHYQEPLPDNTLKAKTNIKGYTGYIPAKKSENVYGNTWTRNNLTSTSAFQRTFRGRNRPGRSDPLAMEKGNSRLEPRGFYDSNQNRRLKTLFVKEGTAVERLQTDDAREIPQFSTSYQDVRRGYSLDPWVGKQVDPAGRMAPVTRQESYSAVPPPGFGARATGTTYYVPGKKSENIYGERENITYHMAKHATRVNRSEHMQR